MAQPKGLKPVEKPRLYDLVREAGLDVSDWADFSRGPKWAAANPKYCYEWAFIEPGRLVILNLWYASLHERRGTVTWSGNLREWIQRHSGPGAKPVWRRRAEFVESAIQEAVRGPLPIRVIVNDGTMRTAQDPKGKASTVKRRLLDPLPWAVSSYARHSGQCTLTRGLIAKGSADQFDFSEDDKKNPERIQISGTRPARDSKVRAAALRRANGKCEFCLSPGFITGDGRIFLETHHVIPFSEGGVDSVDNVAAVCANHHREAHHGSRSKNIRETLLSRLALGGKMEQML